MNTSNSSINVKKIIDDQFPQKKYTISGACEEIKTWTAIELKNLCNKLGQKKQNKDIAIDIIHDCILYASGIKSYEKLISNRFIDCTRWVHVETPQITHPQTEVVKAAPTKGKLLQEGRTLYILHETGKFVKGEKELCNKFYLSVQPDYGRGITDEHAIEFATDLKKKSDMHDKLIGALKQTHREAREIIGNSVKFEDFYKRIELLLQEAEQK